MAGQIIQQATFRAALDPAGYEQGGDRMVRKSAEITNAVDKVGESTTKAGRNAALSSQGFDKLLASIDPNIQRATQYQRELDKLNKYHDAGIASAGQYSTALQLLQSKYGDLAGATNEVAGASRGLGTAVGELDRGLISLSGGMGYHVSQVRLLSRGIFDLVESIGVGRLAIGAVAGGVVYAASQTSLFGLAWQNTEHAVTRAWENITVAYRQFDRAVLSNPDLLRAGGLINENAANNLRWYQAQQDAAASPNGLGPFNLDRRAQIAKAAGLAQLGQSGNEILTSAFAAGPIQQDREKRLQEAKKEYDDHLAALKQFQDDADAAWEKYYAGQRDASQKFWDDVDKQRDKSFEEFQQIWREQPINVTPGPIAEERDRQIKKLADDMSREQERAAHESEQFWNRMFDNIFQSGHISFSKFLEELAVEAYARPIIVPVLQQLGNSLGIGLPGGGGGSVTGGGLGGIGSLLGLGGLGGSFGFPLGDGMVNPVMSLFGGGSPFPSSVNVTPQIFGTGIANPPIGALGTLGAGFVGYGVGSSVSSLIGGNKTSSQTTNGEIGGAIGAAIGTAILPGIGTFIGSALGSLAGGLFGPSRPSNFTAYANFGSDYSLVSGIAGDKPNSQTTGLAQQAGSAIASAAHQLEAAGITLQSGVQRLEIGQRDPSHLFLTSGQRVDIGAAGDVQAAVSGTIDYLLKGATASSTTGNAVLEAYRNNGQLSSETYQKLLEDSGALQAMLDENQHAIDQLTDPVKSAWEDLLKLEKTRIDQAKQYNLDTTLLDRRSQLEQEDFVKKLTDAQRAGLASVVDLSGSIAYQEAQAAAASATARANWEALLADARSGAQGAVSGQIGVLSGVSGTQRGLASSFFGASSSLTSSLSALTTGDLSPLGPIDRYQAARAQLTAARGSALGGDLGALGSLSGLAQTFLGESRNVNASTSAYGADFDFVKSVLGGAASTASGLGTSAQHQADVADAQLNVLHSIDTALRSPTIDTGYLQRMTQSLDRFVNGQGDLSEAVQSIADGQATLADAVKQLQRLLAVDLQQVA